MVTTITTEAPRVKGSSQRGSMESVLQSFLAAKAVVDAAQEKLDSAKAALQDAMGEQERAEVAGFKITYANILTMRLDTKKLKEDQPEVYNAYLAPSTIRPLKVTVA